MSTMPQPSLDDSFKALLIPLYLRAVETQRPDALLRDETAVALVQQLDYDFSRIEQDRIAEETRVAMILRNREFDRYARDFLRRNPRAIVVHIGCGLDTRFERVDNGKVEWFDLDLPGVIELRRRHMGGEKDRYHLLACSVLDSCWQNGVAGDHHSAQSQPSILFLAEGVFMFLEETQVRSLVLRLLNQFPGAELAFDAFSPFFVWANNLRYRRSKIGALCYWALKRGKDLELWGEGIRLLGEWFPFRCPEPRLGSVRWARNIPFLAKTMGIYYYKLGKTTS